MVYGSKDEILQGIGAAVRRERLRQNVSQKVLATRSGVSLNAVKNLETGSGATLGTFVLVCRTLGKDAWIKAFCEQREEISPIEYAEMLNRERKTMRLRASVARKK